MLDDIAAQIACLIDLRRQYLKTGKIYVFDYDVGYDGRYKFYKEAVEKGEIKPGSPYKEDFDKEMRLIANGTQKMWLEKFGDSCVSLNAMLAAFNSDKSGKYTPYYEENYERGRKTALTIKGVDFTKYMDKDVEIPEKGKTALKNALKYGIAIPDSLNGYQSFLAKSCDFFGIDTDFKRNVIGNTQGESGIVGKIFTPIQGTVSAMMYGTYCRLKNAFHTTFPPKNKPIHPVDKNKKSEYRKWEDKDGSRVSEVQHRQLPDMTKDVIQKPTKSYAAEQKKQPDDKEKMIAIINYMNKINGPNKSVNAEKTVADLTQTYGDKALTLLQMAVNEPSNYAKYVGDASLKTSRAAVQHLCRIAEPEKAAEAIIKREISPNYKPEQQPTKKADKENKTENQTSLKDTMKSDFKKYSAAQQKEIAANDAIPEIRKQVERTAQVHSSGAKQADAAKSKTLPDLFKLKQNQNN